MQRLGCCVQDQLKVVAELQNLYQLFVSLIFSALLISLQPDSVCGLMIRPSANKAQITVCIQ